MRQFKTESKKLLDLMINSIYTNKEIFLRELISNASDAVDKLNFKSLQDPSVKLDQGDLAIRVSFDKDARTITISDNGIGMTAEELERNLGTIAHSGSEEFKTENAEQQGSDVDIIGQFGVGFYSAFMVASHVKVVSRAYGEDIAHVWESDGLEGYTIEDGERAEHGTDVILTLRENEKLDADGEAETYDRFLTEWGLKSLIQQYSNYVRYPIQMMVSKSRQKPKPEDAGDDYTPEYEDYQELETVNSMTPIWQIFAGQITLAQPAMIPVTEEGKDIPNAPIVIPPHPLFAGSGGSGAQPVENCTPRVLDKVIIPKNITVHLGKPAASARNVTVSFRDYIANVASSEVYPTWADENNPTGHPELFCSKIPFNRDFLFTRPCILRPDHYTVHQQHCKLPGQVRNLCQFPHTLHLGLDRSTFFLLLFQLGFQLFDSGFCTAYFIEERLVHLKELRRIDQAGHLIQIKLLHRLPPTFNIATQLAQFLPHCLISLPDSGLLLR